MCSDYSRLQFCTHLRVASVRLPLALRRTLFLFFALPLIYLPFPRSVATAFHGIFATSIKKGDNLRVTSLATFPFCATDGIFSGPPKEGRKARLARPRGLLPRWLENGLDHISYYPSRPNFSQKKSSIADVILSIPWYPPPPNVCPCLSYLCSSLRSAVRSPVPGPGPHSPPVSTRKQSRGSSCLVAFRRLTIEWQRACLLPRSPRLLAVSSERGSQQETEARDQARTPF